MIQQVGERTGQKSYSAHPSNTAGSLPLRIRTLLRLIKVIHEPVAIIVLIVSLIPVGIRLVRARVDRSVRVVTIAARVAVGIACGIRHTISPGVAIGVRTGRDEGAGRALKIRYLR